MIVRDTSIIKEHTGINRNIAWATLSPFAKQSEIKYVIPVIGQALYDEINTAIDNDDLTNAHIKLLEWLYPMIANFTIYTAAPQLNIHISELGFQEQSSKEGTSHVASMIRYNDARLSLWRTAIDYREFTYTHLRTNQTNYPLWAESEAYVVYNQLFIRESKELHTHLGYGQSVSTYLTLRPYINMAEETYIYPILGDTMCAHLKKQRETDDLTPEEKQLMEKILPALSWAALYQAAPTLTAVLEDGNLITALPPEQSKVFSPLSEAQLSKIQADAYAKSAQYLSRLKAFLDENISTYPLYENSPAAKNRQTEYNLPNNYGKKSFGFF